MNFNDEQKDAISSRHNEILVSAGAGSGKTAVLATRVVDIIKDINDPVDISRLLIITFTNLATDEMRDRIAKMLSDELNKCKTKKERNHINNQISYLNKASISTFDSFFSDIVKKNFKIADIDPSFRIGEDYEIKKLRNDTMTNMFEKYYEEEKELFYNLIEMFSTDTSTEKIAEIINKIQEQYYVVDDFEKWLDINFNIYENITNIDSIFSSVYGECLINLINNIKEIALKNMKISEIDYSHPDKYLCCDCIYIYNIISILNDEDLFIKADDTDKNNKNQMPTYDELLNHNINSGLCINKEKYLKLMTCVFRDYTLKKAVNSKTDFLNHNEFFNAVMELKMNVLIVDEKKEVNDFSELIINAIDQKNTKNNNEKTAEELIQEKIYKILDKILNESLGTRKEFSLLKKMVKEFNFELLKYKKEHSVFEFSDITRFCYDIIKNNPDIAKEYSSKFTEIIVDEYQDSDHMQEFIFSKLHNSQNRRFSVGDIKQSIYGFRGADADIFAEKYESGDEVKKIYLNKNYRSRDFVIDFVNYIFESIMTKKCGGVNYDENAKLVCGLDYSEFEKEPHNYTDCCEAFVYEMSNEPEEPFEIEGKFIAAKINELLENDTYVFDKEENRMRKMKYEDIAVLVRNKSHASSLIGVLSKYDIPYFYSSDTSLSFFKTTEISTVMALLAIIDNPMCDIEYAAVLNSSIVGITNEEIMKIRNIDLSISLYKSSQIYIEDNPDDILSVKLQIFLDNMRKWKYLSSNMPVSEFISFLYYETGIYEIMGISQNSAVRKANLNILLEKAVSFSENNMGTLFDFLQFINAIKEENEIKPPVENVENVVQIMTIHKSKGLEFPIVFIAGIAKKFNFEKYKTTNKVIVDKKLGLGFCSFRNTKDKIEYSNSHYSKVAPKYISKSFYRKIMESRLKELQRSEEMRVLYVAATRAREKLIFVGAYKTKSGYLEWLINVFENYKAKNDSFKLMMHKKSKKTNEPDDDGLKKYVNSVPESSKSIPEIKISEIVHNLKELSDYNFIRETKEHIEDILKWEYFNKQDTLTPTSVSVSEIKKQHLQQFMNEPFESGNYTGNIISISDPEKLTGAERGTAYHTLMEHLDFHISSEKELKKLINDLVERNILTKKQAECIKLSQIMDFLDSDICKNGLLFNSYDKIKREQAFTVQFKPKDIYVNRPEYANCRRNILVHGEIDLYYENNNKEIVLVDYKTDLETDEKKIRQKYGIQLKTYKYALEKALNKPVAKTYIYLFSSSKIIEL